MSKSVAAENIHLYRKVMFRGLAAVPLLLSLLFVVALGMSNDWFPQGREDGYTVICMFIASFTGGLCGLHKANSNRLIIAICSECGLILFLIFLGLLTKESDFFNILLLYNFLALLSGTLLASLIVSKGKKQRRSRKKYYKL